MIEDGLELKDELFELLLCKLKFAILLIAHNGETHKHVFRNNFDIALHFEGV